MPRYVALILGCRATIHADAGVPLLAESSLGLGRRAAAACTSEPALLATLDIHALHVAFAAAPADGRDAILAEARGRAAPFLSDDPRFALGLLELRAHPADVTGDGALVVGENGHRFRAPGARAWTDLERRAPLRRVLLALARERRDAPGETLAVDQILAAGWPGERVGYAAAANRVYVALATLRKLGLRDVILTGEGGYLLSPTIPIVLDP